MEESIGSREFSASFDLTTSRKYYDDDDDWSSVPKNYQWKQVKRVCTNELMINNGIHFRLTVY